MSDIEKALEAATEDAFAVLWDANTNYTYRVDDAARAAVLAFLRAMPPCTEPYEAGYRYAMVPSRMIAEIEKLGQ
jgi:hypothetical protein